MVDRLTALDATFLELEQLDDGATMHIGGVLVFEPLPDGSVPALDRLREHIGARLDLLPRYSRRLSHERTGGLGWPSWEEDPRFDVRNHVHRATLPAPGGDAELSKWAGEFFSHRLDRTRPLWEMVLVDGLAGGRWALATKTHHALVDGVGSIGVTQLLLDAVPEPVPNALGAPAPDQLESLWHALLPHAPAVIGDLARAGARTAGAALHAAAHPRETFERSRSLAELFVRDELTAAPRTSINAPIGAARRYEIVRLSLDELKAIGRTVGGSVNDVVLAACSAGLRSMLLSRGEPLPARDMRAMVPMNVRAHAESLALGNRVSSLFVELPVAEADAAARLREVIRRTRMLKASSAALGAATMLDLTALAPPLVHALIARSLYATRLFNLTITNVPGPRVPLYLLGAPLREIHPLVPLAAEHAVGIAIVSYDGGVVIGIAADRDSTPDLHVLAGGIRRDLARLRALLPDHAPPRPRMSERRVASDDGQPPPAAAQGAGAHAGARR